MKLHIVPGSPHSRKVEAVVLHLGLDVEIQEHDLFAGDLRKSAYLEINPTGRVPTLEDGKFVLWESIAIMQYLAERAGNQQLLPRDPRARADVLRWQSWDLAHFSRPFSALAFETVAKPRRGLHTDGAAVERAQADLARSAPVLDAYVADRRYLVGEDVTLADYSLLMFEGYRSLVPFDWSAYTHLNTYLDRMSQLEPWIRSKRQPIAAAA
jgi:glutathione S-transferase